MADVSNESLVDEREEVMVPYNGGKPTLRKAHFLKSTFTFNSMQDHLLLPPPPPPSLISSKPTFNQLKKSRLVSYKGYPQENWKTWVHILKPKFQDVWKKAGIYEAILASTHKIPRDKNLIINLAKSWCGGTNTFIFPWGEVTITLEDIINLGCYSVLGISFSTPLPEEFAHIFYGMRKAHHQIKLRNGNVTASMWMKYFMHSGKQLEHEAFLAMWLCRFVFIQSHYYMALHYFPVAIHLSRGTRIALAPLVLASIYRDMSLLSKSMIESSTFGNGSIKFVDHADLLQMWAWERFPELRPIPNSIQSGEPRSARWNGVINLKVKDVSVALASAGKSFLWRPYAVISSNCMLTEMYRDNEQWIVVESDESEAFARCLRVSDIVGLGFTEQHNPNRVAMQFGLDQDIPPRVIRSNGSLETAWCSYNRPIRDAKLYVPPRHFESDVSSRYLDWWRGIMPAINEDATRLPLISCGPKRDSVATPGPGCASICLNYERPQDNVEVDSLLTIAQLLSRRTSGSDENRKDADNEPVLALGSETRTKYLCITEPAELSVPSSEKCAKSKSSTEKQNEQAENAVVSSVNAEEENRDDGTSEVPQLELETHISRPDEVNTVDTEEERRDKTTAEAPKLELKTRILRLELIVDMIKTAKLASSSRDIN